MSRLKVKFWGGPEDGADRWMTEPLSEFIEIFGIPARVDIPGGHAEVLKGYHYSLNKINEEWIYQFNHEWIEKEVPKVGLRKHGVGEVLSEESDLTKQASQQWSDDDEQELLNEE